MDGQFRPSIALLSRRKISRMVVGELMFNVKKVGNEWRVLSLPSNKCVMQLTREQLEDLVFQLEVAIIEENISEEETECLQRSRNE